MTVSALLPSFEDAKLTREEKQVTAYSTNQIPTIPSSVTPSTPLEELNLNWREKELPERERTKHVHRLHPYLGKYIPQLVEIFLRKYFRKRQTVLDPFCGSGTTLVQANELGVNSIGFDVSAFNVLLCKAKTDSYDLHKVRMEILDILGKVERATRPDSKNLLLWDDDLLQKESLSGTTQYLREWFAPQALRDLLTYRDLISEFHYQELLKIILSRAARSSRLTTHFDLDFPKKPQTEPYHCYKHSRICEPTTNSLQFLRRYSLDTIKRIEQFSHKRTDATVEIHHADSREVNIPQVDGIITSPPYVGLINYHEQHTYAYHLLGLEDQRNKEIGAASNGAGQKARKLYQEEIASVFQRASESMKPGSPIIVVAADKANLYGEIARLANVEVEAVVTRHVNRRTGRRAGEFYETVFIWRKPSGRRYKNTS